MEIFDDIDVVNKSNMHRTAILEATCEIFIRVIATTFFKWIRCCTPPKTVVHGIRVQKIYSTFVKCTVFSSSKQSILSTLPETYYC